MKIYGFIFGLWLYVFWFYDTNDFKSPRILPMPMNKNLQICSKKCWERSVKRNSNRNFIRVIKNSSFDQHFLCICMVKTFLKIIWWRFLVPCSELLLVNCVYLSCKIRNISTLSMLLCHSTNSFFLRSISLMHRLVCSVH